VREKMAAGCTENLVLFTLSWPLKLYPFVLALQIFRKKSRLAMKIFFFNHLDTAIEKMP